MDVLLFRVPRTTQYPMSVMCESSSATSVRVKTG